MYRGINIPYCRFRLFQIMWLVFILNHMVVSASGWTSIGGGFLSPSNVYFLIIDILVVIFSIAALFRPQKFYLFLLALICFTIVKLDVMPVVPNHIVLMLIIHFTIFLSLMLYWDWSLDIKERSAQWFNKLAPYLRIELLIVYFFVVLHKINYDFFDPTVSCSVELYTDIAGTYPFLPQGPWIDRLMIVFTLGFEALIPILLIIPSTRLLGILAGLVFHFLLSLHPNMMILSFTAEFYALFTLFLPDDTIIKIIRFIKQKAERVNLRQLAYVATGGLLVIGGFFTARLTIQGTLSPADLKEGVAQLFTVAWIAWCLFLITGLVTVFGDRLIDRKNLSYYPALFKVSWSPLLVFLALTIFNGVTPYIGLKTATSFSMFSNLRVAGEENNHLFVPSSFQVVDFQKDTVSLIDSNHPYLRKIIEQDEIITSFELNKFLYQNQSEEIELTYRYNEDIRTIRLPQQQADDRWQSYSWIARKLLIFKGVPKSGPTPCQW